MVAFGRTIHLQQLLRDVVSNIKLLYLEPRLSDISDKSMFDHLNKNKEVGVHMSYLVILLHIVQLYIV